MALSKRGAGAEALASLIGMCGAAMADDPRAALALAEADAAASSGDGGVRWQGLLSGDGAEAEAARGVCIAAEARLEGSIGVGLGAACAIKSMMAERRRIAGEYEASRTALEDALAAGSAPDSAEWREAAARHDSALARLLGAERAVERMEALRDLAAHEAGVLHEACLMARRRLAGLRRERTACMAGTGTARRG